MDRLKYLILFFLIFVAQTLSMATTGDLYYDIERVHILQIDEVCDTVAIRDTACVGDTYQKNGFLLKNLSIGVYFDTLRISESNPCKLLCLELYVFQNPQLSLSCLSDTLVCKGESVELCASASVQWNHYPIHVGDILCSDSTILRVDEYLKSSKTAIGVVYYVDGSGFHGSAIALKDGREEVPWSNEPTPSDWVYVSSNQCVFDINGTANTQRMLASSQPSAFLVLRNIDVANGWYLPAYGQMRLMYANYSEVLMTLRALANMGVDVDAFSGIYWTSTQCSSTEACAFGYRGLATIYSLDKIRKTRAGIDF